MYIKLKKAIINISLLAIACISNPVSSAGIRTEICIENKSATSYYITGVDVDNYDWQDLYNNGAMNRPDHNWVNVLVKPSEVRCNLADVNEYASSVGFSFSINETDAVAPTNNRVETKLVRTNIFDVIVQHWRLIKTEADHAGRAGSLSNRVACLAPKDPVAKHCDMFVIKK